MRWSVTANQWRAMPRPATAFSPHSSVRKYASPVVPSSRPNSIQV